MKGVSGLDLIHLQIMWSRLLSVVEEQAQTLVRTAFSTAVREAGDLSAGVFDLQGRMLAQAITGTPGHVNAMAASVGFFLEKYPIGNMVEGDVYLTNDPWLGTGHLHDFTVVTPVFRRGDAVALFASTSHVVDVGGRGFGPDARQVYEEGINVPIMPLVQAGTMNRFLLEIVAANVREPLQVEGDLYSLIACNDMGRRRLDAMMTEFGLQTIDGLAQHIIESSRRAMLDEIGKIRPGVYENAMRVDGYDRDLDLVARMTVGEDGIDIDFTGTSPISGYGINVPITYTQAYASFGVRCIVGASTPNNAGSLAPIRVSAPAGSILNAQPPCAVSARHIIGQMLPDVVLGCLHKALGDVVPAEGASSLWNPLVMGGHGVTGDDDYGDAMPFTINLFHAGGTGARPGKDGLSATAFPSGVRSTPVEINETIAPLLVTRKEYRIDSGGAGHNRGGTGQVMEITHAEGAPFAVSTMFDRIRHPPRGRGGGKQGLRGTVTLASGPSLRGKGRQPIPTGDGVVMNMPGGGGLGDPLTRDAGRVADDVRDGLVSRQAALDDYGVVIGDDGTFDEAASAARRRQG
jgi:N-methylhydantoinase B